MSENEYKDLHEGIENLINTFGGNSTEKNVDADVSVDELLNTDISESEEDLDVTEDELDASVDNVNESEKKASKDNNNTSNNNGKKSNNSHKNTEKASDKNKNKGSKADKNKDKSSADDNLTEEKTTSPARLIVTLVAICAAVALLLGAVNLFTKSQIEENNRKAVLESIRKIFDSTVEVRDIEISEDSGLGSAYLVIKNGCICGYSATVTPNGFGGPINLMVGISSDGKVVGVDVVSMSETPGLGSRVSGRDFLSQFKDASGEVQVDVISGASISSRAVGAGVNTVTANLIDLQSLAEKYGMSIIPFEADTPAVEENAATDDEAVVPTPPETEPPANTNKGQSAPEVSKNDSPPDVIVPNPGDGNGGVNAEYASDTTEYETLTTEPESTEPETSVSEESETE